ncbi:MAG: DUF4162 domain-containing protein, partial [Planctomycetota bacterium]
GAVDEISNAVAAHSRVHVRVLEGADELADWLRSHDGVADLSRSGDRLLFDHTGDEASQAQLLAEIIATGRRVVEFGCRPMSLEDVFLQVTKGRVQ